MKLPHLVLASAVATASLVSLVPTRTFAATNGEPFWAYGFNAPAAPGETATLPGPPTRALHEGENAAELTAQHHLAGSSGSYSRVEIRNGNDVVDWFPEDHPPMSAIMKRGPASLGENAYGCAFCHLPNGRGKPENAPVAGLPAAYFARQLHDFKNGLRGSADRRKANTLLMIELAQAMSDEEIAESAAYFAGLAWQPWIRVVETDHVPRTRTSAGMYLPIETQPTEALGSRIIEVPENPDETELLRNPRSGFLAYVPFGSVEKGKALVATGGATVVDGQIVPGKTIACTICHGPDLRGVAEIPGIAGRSPSYLARQLYDFQQGTRKAPLAQLMQPVVAKLTNDDFVAIAAYIASLDPRPAAPASHL